MPEKVKRPFSLIPLTGPNFFDLVAEKKVWGRLDPRMGVRMMGEVFVMDEMQLVDRWRWNIICQFHVFATFHDIYLV